MIILDVTIPGDPVAWHRAGHRVTKKGFVQSYTKKEDGDYREKLFWIVKHSIAKPIARPQRIFIVVEVFRPVPKSATKAMRELMLADRVSPVGRPDADNYLKQIMDGLNSVVWEDDSQITKIEVQKIYSEMPRLRLVVATY